MRRFLSAVLPAVGQDVHLDPDTSHHVLRVTGIAPGEALVLFDGQGAQVSAELVGAADGRAVCRGVAAIEAPPPLPPVWLLCALLKQGTFDQAVRQATELGVTAIVPVLARRSVPRGDRAARWQRIVASAAAQCGRADVPLMHEPCALDAALDLVPAHLPRWICLPGAPPLTAPGSAGGAVLIGPEGGWAPTEIGSATQAGVRPMGLGRLVLRADTAVVAALAALTVG